MNKWLCRVIVGSIACFALVGCATTEAGKIASDLGLAGAGAVVGYQVSDGETLPTAAGAVVGYAASRIAQSEHARALREAEKRGYERAMNQSVKQQYWIIQNQQQRPSVEDESAPRLVPVVIPESNINGVIIQPHIEYLRIEQ